MQLKLIFISLIVGLINGFLITFYETTLEFCKKLFFGGNPFLAIEKLPIWYLYVLPTITILIVNFLISSNPHIREYAINDIADSIAQNKMVINFKILFLKIFSSVISLSSGFVVGTEGPSAGIGAMVAFQIYKFFKLPKVFMKLLISIGASSAIAAIFVSPLTGISFAFEYIAHKFLKQYMGYLIISSVMAFAISNNFLEPIIFRHSLGREFDKEFIVINFLFIPYVTFFIYFYLFLKRKVLHIVDLEIFKKVHHLRNYIFAVIGGGVVGTILLIEPHAAFSGKEMLIYLINHQEPMSLALIFTIVLLRIVGTTVSIYANAVGGLFLPIMSIGALVGFSFGDILSYYHLTSEPFYFAAIGAAVFMGVLMKLPLTAVVLALETTFDYNVVVATGISVVIVGFITSINFEIRRKYIDSIERKRKIKKHS